MKNSTLRLAAVAAVLGAALSANAFVITVTGDYTGGISNPSLTVTSEQSNLVGLENFAVYTLQAPVTGTTSTINLDFKSASNTLLLSGQGFAVTSGTTSFAGTWTGTYTGDATITSGTYSGTYDKSGKFSIAVAGEPVPEPASMAALGIGAVALLRRRRKA